ncbi:histidine kinase [Paraconexibacter antarcticus]|uniref:Oxygen sensor histidine kinase NreB n=1 Tax=Paraconexibacter antarcticus TaxID=2949664 RepID=A0ABY5DSK1_9ACTN|nr:histidine kinase [Paraconexibacter antarcticus]UTI63702.1 histidine kinase [Paraconexibacter antarcticus]
MTRARRLARSPVTHFAVSGLLAVALVAVVALALLRSSARTEALRDAQRLTRLAGRGIAEPALTPAVLRRDPAALRALDRIIRTRVLGGPVVRVKIWRPDGTIVYSDDRRLIGERYALGEDELGVLRHNGIQAEISDLERPENRFERRFHRLTEVYLPVASPAGGRLLFETYLRDSAITASGHRIWRTFVPILLGALLLLEATQVPLAASLARRLRRAQREREELLHAAVTASEAERRRIARDLHDGVVQDLASVSYELGAAARAPDPQAAARATEAAAGQVRRSIRRLRSLVLDLYPDTLHRQGLEGALGDLLAGAQTHGLRTHLRIDDGARPGPAAEAVVFRTAQEALRNVVAHAAATEVDVALARHDGAWMLTVRDDGRGTPAVPSAGPHFGLRMLADLASEHGGVLDVRSGQDTGTTVTLTLPGAPGT